MPYTPRKHNWGWVERTDEELHTIARDLYDMKVYTSFHCGNLIISVFMPLLFMGAPPTPPSPTGNIKQERKNKLTYMADKQQYELETPERNAFMENIGMVFEYMDKAGPMAINGCPIFTECQLLSKSDTDRFRKIYNDYCEARKKFEEQFGKK